MKVSAGEVALLFKAIDADQSGTIELSELSLALQQRGQSATQVASLFDALDVDGDGVIGMWRHLPHVTDGSCP